MRLPWGVVGLHVNLVEPFQGKALALPLGSDRPCSLQVQPADPHCSLLAGPGIPRTLEAFEEWTLETDPQSSSPDTVLLAVQL